MDQCTYRAIDGRDPPSMRSVNGDMRRAAANLALIINECGLSQSELSRRSGVSRQLVNGWAKQRVSVAFSDRGSVPELPALDAGGSAARRARALCKARQDAAVGAA